MHTPVASFNRQLDVLADHDVVSLDETIDRLRLGDNRPWVVLTKPLEPSDTRPPASDRLHLRSSNPNLIQEALPFVQDDDMEFDSTSGGEETWLRRSLRPTWAETVDDVDDSREVSDLRLDSAMISSTRGPRPLP